MQVERAAVEGEVPGGRAKSKSIAQLQLPALPALSRRCSSAYRKA